MGKGIEMKINKKWGKIVVIGCFVCCTVLQGISFDSYTFAMASMETGQEEEGQEQAGQEQAGQEQTGQVQTGQVQPEKVDSKEAVDSTGGTALVIDSKNIYEGMAASYAKGYVPKVSEDKAIVVLPLLSKKELKNKQMTASLQLAESQTQPFVYKNYEKTVSFGYYKTAKKGKKPDVTLLLSVCV